MTASWPVESVRRISYRVALVPGLLDPGQHELAAALGLDGRPARRLVVSDPLVWALYGDGFAAYLRQHGASCDVHLLDPGEAAKGMDQVLEVVAACDSSQIQRRRTPIVAFGGGSVLDIAGLAASLYKRGVPHLRVPTSLVGMIDAGIGVKVGVNHLGKKSAVGAYHPPTEVLVDPAFLRSLDRRWVSAGLAEAIKIALVCDAALFESIEADADVLMSDIARSTSGRGVLGGSIAAMLAELSGNLWEERLERLADFGHTFSPGIEMAAIPRLTHGEAVALDVVVSGMLAVRRGLLDHADFQRIRRVLTDVSLPLDDEVVTLELLSAALESSTRHRDGLQRVPLLTGIGRASFVNDISATELQGALEELRSRSGAS